MIEEIAPSPVVFRSVYSKIVIKFYKKGTTMKYEILFAGNGSKRSRCEKLTFGYLGT